MKHPHAARFFRGCIRALAGEPVGGEAFATQTPDAQTPDARSPAVGAGSGTGTGSCGTRAQTSESDDGAIGEITLLPHQREGARRLRATLERHGGALLADEVGLGKTFTALYVARAARRVLIVAPASLRSMWEDSCRRTAIAATITSYERVSAGSHPRDGQWDLVILDEAHHARSPSTRRYAALCELTRGARVLLLTATPIHNRLADLQSLFALFLGAGAERLDSSALSALIVRRRERDLDRRLPALDALRRHPVPHADGVLPAIRALPPPLPPADGGLAHALVRLQLTRAWCSSDAALLTAIRNRLSTATALEHALANGRLPTRRDLSAWSAGSDGSVQLAFAELVAAPAAEGETRTPLTVVRDHAESLRRLRALVRGPAARDRARMATLASVLDARAAGPAIVFTHSTATAECAFRSLRERFRVALLTGRGACIASGPVPRADVLRQFAPLDVGTARAPGGDASPNDIMRIDVLVASDVVSEGVDLQRAGVIVHLDLPWTVARLEQRIGRVRRLGSSHASVESHLITPPVDAEELQLTLAHLSRKATLAGHTVGRSSILGDTHVWRGILPETPTIAPATVRRTLIDALRELESLATSTSPQAPDASCASHAADTACTPQLVDAPTPPGRAPPLPVHWRVLGQRAPLVLALVALDGEPHLVCARGDDVLLDPAAVVAELAAVVADVRLHDHRGDGPRESRPSVCAGASTEPHLLESRVRAWCSERTAAGLLSLPQASNSPSHRRLMHAIDRVAARAPRTRRARVVSAAATARALAAAQRGAGSERVLDALVAAVPPSRSSMDDALEWLARIGTSLQPPHSPPPRDVRSPASACGAQLLEMLTLLPAEEPG